MHSEVVVWDGSVPVSARFGEGYFSRAGGEGETRTIFLAGNGLPERWAVHAGGPFRIAELGFGTGLNFRVTLMAWREFWRVRGRRPEFELEFSSVEAFPLGVTDMVRGGWVPEVWGVWTPVGPRWERAWEADGVRLRVDFCDVTEFFGLLDGVAHAWYLDGFSPARNPSMWAASVLAGVAARSGSGTTVATFSAASAVRKGLEAVGFRMSRRPGFAGKRESLSGVYAGPGSFKPNAGSSL